MSLRFLFVFLASFAFPLAGCPVAADDDSAADDDDAGDDDDAAEDPCENPEDITAEVEAGESVSGGTNNENDDFSGSCDEADFGSNDALFVFTPGATGRYLFSTEDASTDFDTQLVAFTDCERPGATEIGCNDDIDVDAENFASEMTLELDEGVPVYVVVDGYEALGHYEMTITPVICGDGLVAGEEMCDDGNTTSGDGCDAGCVWECVDDAAEDDDAIDTATPLAAFPSVIDGTLCPTDATEEFGVFADLIAVDQVVGEYAQATLAPTGDEDCTDLDLDAGFFDNGFGGEQGTRAVLEVRPHDVPFLLEDGQVFFKLEFFKTQEAPEVVYGDNRLSSHYQGQSLKLSKHFRAT